MHYGGHASPPTGPHVHSGSRDGSGGGHAAEETGGQGLHTLADQLTVRVVRPVSEIDAATRADSRDSMAARTATVRIGAARAETVVYPGSRQTRTG